MNFQPFVLKGISEESSDVRTFRFAKEDGSVPKYQPGNFFLMRMQDSATGKPTQRSYSVASHPDEPELAFCVRLKGAFTHLLWNLKVGDTVELDGPYGTFMLRADDTERVFIGGGVGISALRSMILQTAKHDNKRAWLFHSARKFENLTYFPEMKKLASENHLFKFYSCVTGEEKPAGWNGYCERISVAMIKKVLGSLSDKTFYFCGSKEMGAELSSALQAEGVPKDRIKKDEWV
jgi:ferredoxin-NADP reductase